MKTNKIDNNQPSFKWTIPVKNAKKKCGLETFRFSNRMNGFGQYDVYIKPLETKTTRYRDLGCMGILLYPLAISFSATAGTGIAGFVFNHFLPNLAGGFLQFGAGLLSSIPIAAGLIGAIMFQRVNDFSVQAATHRGETKDEDRNPTPAGIVTQEYVVKNDGNRYNPPVDFVSEIQRLKQEKFKNFIKHYDTNDLFISKNYARVLKNKPQGLGVDFFNYKIDDKGNTLTTAFFDLVPDKELYPKIIEYLQRQQNMDYNQKDGNGISCIEKVLISENKEALQLILNSKYTSEFGKPYCWYFDNPDAKLNDKKIHDPSKISYSPELDDIYLNIQDKEFKKMVDDNIKWDFSNWIAVIKSNDVSKVEKLKKRFNSPLLNKQQMYNDINKALSKCKDMNFITYMQTNFLKELLKNEKEKEK